MSLIFVRHAQSQGNATGDYSTATHDSLSELGHRQAHALAAVLARHSIARVLVSPLTRTVQTIHPYLQCSNHIAEIWPELAEGCWQARDLTPAATFPTEPCILPEDLAPHFTFRDGRPLRPCGHETFAQGFYRARLVLQRLEPYSTGPSDTLVVTHGHMLREMLNLITVAPEPVEFAHDNCGLTRIERTPSHWVIHYLNRPTWNPDSP